jgi:formate dehydrogenase iron-sulfur subunit
MVRRALLFDSTLCIGCEACVGACKEANRLPAAVDKRLTAATWTVVEQRDGAFIRRLCMHCESPTCASVCPVGAFQKDPAGPVRYDASRCIGCRYCIMACPFDVPKYQWDRVVPLVQKCTMCADRVVAGKVTACAEACPTGATRFGDRPALIREAQARIAAEPSKYVPTPYGVEEVGGTDVLLLAGVPFQRLGIRPARREPLPLLTWRILARVPDFGLVAGTLLYGISWITHRRIRLQAERAREADGGRPEA